jgi:hypothetical protein
MLSTVSANAAVTVNSLTVGTPGAARAGATSLLPVTFNFTSATSDSFTVGARIQTAPTGSNAINLTATTAEASSVLSISADVTGNITYAASGTNSYAMSGGLDGVAVDTLVSISTTAATSATVYFNFTPDVAGTYTFLYWAGGTTWSASYKQASGSVTSAGAPASIVITKLGSTIPDTDQTVGAVVGITLKDAAGNATRLAAGESLSISDTSSETTIQAMGASLGTGGGTITSFAPGNDYLAAGTYYARIVSADGSAADATSTLTVSGSGGLIAATVTTNTTLSVVDVDAATGATIALTSATGYSTDATMIAAASADYVTTKSSHGFTATIAAAADGDTSFPVVVAMPGGYSVASTFTVLDTKTTGNFTVTAALSATSTQNLTVTVAASSKEIGYTAATATTTAIVGASTVIAATGATTSWTVQVTDQYAVGIPYSAITVAVSGRNTVTTKSIGVTNADGFLTYSHKDAGTTGTVDTLTFTGTSAVEGIVNYGTVTVDTITVSGGSKAETVAGSTLTAISAADNGPEDSAVAISAVVKDASGNLLAGVPVTFSVDKGAIKKTSGIDYATVYTSSAGKATTYVFGWVSGKQTVTATAGTKSGTDYITWAATDASSARVLSATSSGNVVSMKVVDRFGNGVKGVTIDLARVGSGFFGTGKSTDSVATDKNGTADIAFNGAGTVTASLAATYLQAYDVAGEIEETAVTAAVAGTTEGTGASLAPTGVNTVSVEATAGSDSSTVAATAAADAAAEATDAANAATDAANAAAEAADAATAAAQDAADAVAALSAQVATLISGLKSQLTALTNLVIKIQKKVKA